MKIQIQAWSVETLVKNQSKINPKPQYQRTSVWSSNKKQLLIDSIIRGYDLPKFYLAATEHDRIFDFETVDGQQRMRAIWGFYKGEVVLPYLEIDGSEESNVTYELLKSNYPDLAKAIDNYQLTISVVEQGDPEDIRILFQRLQIGERLNPVELRHAVPSNYGAMVFSVCENHPFFTECRIPNKRYKHQDYLDHALALEHYQTMSDIKAPNILHMYEELASVTMNEVREKFKHTNRVLSMMQEVNALQPGLFRNKWAFVDTFHLLYGHIDEIDSINASRFKESFVEFETLRKKFNKEPEKLIQNNRKSSTYDRDLYDYILSFNTSGATKQNLIRRAEVFEVKFWNDKNFVIKSIDNDNT